MVVGYEPRKNIPLLIEVFAVLASRHPCLDLVVVAAEKKKRDYLRQLAGKLNLDSRVIILAALQADSLAVLYNLAEVFVFPAERESLGIARLRRWLVELPQSP
jgi:glycosyltransferase involved in cell wall biosynthesis